MSIPNVTEIPTETIALQTYEDADYGFTFDYPAAWMLDVIALGDRAPHSIQLTSWTHEPGQISEVQAGGTVVNVTIQLWDPQGDLAAFVEQRKTAWDASGITIVLQEQLLLSGDRVAQAFIVMSSEEESYFFFTVLGEQYLVVSGSGDIEAIRQLAQSLR